MTQQREMTQNPASRQQTGIVYLVDDDPSVLRALCRLLQAAGYRVETCASAQQFLECDRPDAASCAVLDLWMPELGGLELQKSIAEAEEPMPVIFLTGRGDLVSSVCAMKGGALDFLTKPVRGDQLLDAVRGALARDTAERKARRLKRDWCTRFECLSLREREVFSLVVRGLPNKQIADVMAISERTVKAHRAQVMHKMGVQSPAELGRAVEWLSEFSGALVSSGL
jgi:FixJ family two-component response regulator